MSEIISLSSQNIPSDNTKTSRIGDYGEMLAARFLQKNGYRLVLSNYKIPVGRNLRGVAVTGEIDLIALDKNVLCFVEVKTRSSDKFSSPLSAVDLRKQRQITRTARVYRKIFRLQNIPFRYDVIGIVLNEKKAPQIQIFKKFWTEDKFRKNVWADNFS